MVLSDIIYNIGIVGGKYTDTYITNDITKLNTMDSVKYPVLGVTQNVHNGNDEGNEITYSLNLFYVDRLMDDWEDNDLDIQSDGIVVLNSILRDLKNKLDIEIEDRRYTPFNQRFKDECAGVYLTCNVITPLIIECE